MENPTSWSTLRDIIAPITHAWAGWLPNGLLTLLAAQPGRGKSALALRLCQTFTQGTAWPDGTRYRGPRGKVLWCECESAQAINLQRARDWGLKTDRIVCPLTDGTQDARLDDPDHREAIARILNDPEVRFAVVDSLRGSHRGDENSSATMEIMSWLACLARDTGKPILVTHHLRKSQLREVTLDRVRGSSAITQPCRLVWALDSPRPDVPSLVRLHTIKNNLGTHPSPVFFTVSRSGLCFQAPTDQPAAPMRPLTRACNLLKVLLSASSWVAATDIQEATGSAGISWATVKRAKEHLGIAVAKNGTDAKWYWSLPASEQAALVSRA